MAGTIALAVAGFTLCIVLWMLRRLYGERLRMESRLEAVSDLKLTAAAEEPEELHLPLSERVFYPLLRSLGGSVQTFAPSALKTSLSKRIGLAGMKVTPEQWAGWYIVSAAGGLLMGIALVMVGGRVRQQAFLLSISLVLVGAMIPELILRQRITRRQTAIIRALPDVLDLITVSVKAGLGFDSALLKVTEKMKGPLPQEMSQVLHEVKMGVSRRDALKALAERTGVGELQSFVSTIIQADQLGVSISNVLQLQSEGLREHRRQVAEEKAMKAPVKMLFPLVMFIFPTLFIVLLGPAMLQILKQFMNM